MKDEVSGYVYRPFWDNLPFADIHFSITPDILHQLYQGVLKHLISWCQIILGTDELDRRIRCLPPAYGVRHFSNGISALSQISGKERKNMGKILLGCLIGSNMPNQAISAVRAILDFIYLAQYPTHDEDTLGYMRDALSRWHQNKACFITLEVHESLNIPKFHALEHYLDMIRFFGTTDNFNTEMFERLHIDFAKKGWRASNKRDEFPQMTRWLSQQENIQTFNQELSWVLEQHEIHMQSPSLSSSTIATPSSSGPSISSSHVYLPKTPTSPNKKLSDIERTHCVPLFSCHIKEYLGMLDPAATKSSIQDAVNYPIPFERVNVYNSFKSAPTSLEDDVDEKDVVKASPLHGGRFDTVVVLTGDTAEAVSFTGDS
ncbi:hypothetical protein BT96DRAFT_835060 [Gymnopus androsaceus JB14]|uniref:Uncharacterized protein n=1 Tax=Gymnopus androsaceus JB14 TaxID=1447944 RepID=A0A6A4GV44_9AGAR|nr:hypothetical protein BT96DRAFT_835060 [Gymnopus androsaceus JB14]